MPLILAPQGESMTVVRVAAESKVSRHLVDMGIAPGAEIALLSSASGNAVVNVGGVRVALDSKIARLIFVCKKTAA